MENSLNRGFCIIIEKKKKTVLFDTVFYLNLPAVTPEFHESKQQQKIIRRKNFFFFFYKFIFFY